MENSRLLSLCRQDLLQRRVLRELHESTSGVQWESNAHWNTRALLSEWDGVDVDEDGNVVQLALWENRLIGKRQVPFAELVFLIVTTDFNRKLCKQGGSRKASSC